jgi:Mg-chelatase subunit ChlD
LGLVTAWTLLVTHRPRLTPMFAAVITEYEWPVDPNAWASEDLERFETLAHEALEIVDLSVDWRSRDLALRRLDAELETFVSERSLPETVVFYFSLHGVVDAEGRPHLLPADASPIDSATWLPVSEVLDLICQKLPAEVNKLVLLDSNRSAANWRIGQLHNTFADRLDTVLDPEQHPGVVIINSASPNQVGWSAPALTGSLFGFLVARALGTTEREDMPKESQVKLHALVAELNREMKRWSQMHQMPEQQVLVVPADADDFAISWSLPAEVVDRLFQQLTLDASPLIATKDRDLLWREASELPRQTLLSVVPEKLNEVEHRLLHLEKLAVAGKGYVSQAKLQQVATEKSLQDLTSALADSGTRISPVAIRGKLGRDAASVRGATAVANSPAPSLELSGMLGSVSADSVESVRRQWQELMTGVTAERLRAMVEKLDATSGSRVGTAGSSPAGSDPAGAISTAANTVPLSFEDAQVLRLMTRYRILDRWSRLGPIVELLGLRADFDRLSVMRTKAGGHEPRALAWVAPAVANADDQRLLIEDLLLAGPAAAATDLELQMAATRNAYLAAERRMEDVHRAISTCDDAIQKLPYFANGLAELMPRRDTDTEQLSGDLFVTHVLPAIRDAITLSRQLDAATPAEIAGTDAVLPFLETTDRLAGLMAYLDQRLDELLKHHIQNPETNGETLLELRAALELPWIPWQSRRDLRQIHDNIARSIVIEKAVQGAAGETGSDSITWSPAQEAPATRALTTLDRILSWPVHPAVLFSSPEPAEGSNSDASLTSSTVGALDSGPTRVERLGGQVRESLAHWSGDAKSNPWDDPSTGIRDWQAAARWQRRTLPFVAARSTTSPLETVWRESLQRLLVWHANRKLDAFVGTPNERLAVAPRNTFFDQACDQCLGLVSSLGTESSDIQRDVASTRKRQAMRRLAARTGLVTDTKRLPIPPTGDTAAFEVTVTPTLPAPPASAPSDAPFPAGRPSVWVQNERQDLATEVSLLQLPFNQPQELSLNKLSDVPADSPRMLAKTMFRGHEFIHPFIVNRLSGPLVDYVPHDYGPSTISLLGQRRKRVSIMFVLDCSQSMDQPLTGESRVDVGPSKLDLAKSALVTMLDELSRQDGARVGVILLGHRIAWTRSEPPKLSQAPGATASLPQDLMPSQDVETILPLGRFDAGSVLQRLDSVKPWGQTPLNLALVEAMRAFRADDPDTEKNIIVISDGRDYQFTPNRSDIRQPPRTTQADVVRVANEMQVPVFLIGFGLPTEERDAAEREFNQLATITQGGTVTVNDSSDLLREIRARVAAGTFSVDKPPAANQAADGTRTVNASLNGTVTIDPRGLGGNPVQLVFESATAAIPLAGGEALRIQLSADGQNFLPVPFDWQFPQSFGLVSGTQERQSPYELRVHRPEVKAGSVSFPVSVQSAIEPVTRRPSDAWLVVTPLIQGVEKADHRYWFYDANFEPGQPVPLLKWRANDWPQEARSARLQFWCRFDPTPPLQEFSLQDVLQQPAKYADLRLADFPSIGLQVSVSQRTSDAGDYVLNVIQRHDDSSPDLGQLRVEFRCGQPYQPIRVTHQFDSVNAMVSHTFIFKSADAVALERSDQSRFVLTARSASQAAALHPAGGRPIDVDIFAAADLITVGGAR